MSPVSIARKYASAVMQRDNAISGPLFAGYEIFAALMKFELLDALKDAGIDPETVSESVDLDHVRFICEMEYGPGLSDDFIIAKAIQMFAIGRIMEQLP